MCVLCVFVFSSRRRHTRGALVTGVQTCALPIGGTTPTTEVIQFEMSWAHRPATSRLSWLNKSEFRSDKVRDAIAGQPGPIGGGALTIDGDATSRRLLNSLSVNWTPLGERGEDGMWYERAEIRSEEHTSELQSLMRISYA